MRQLNGTFHKNKSVLRSYNNESIVETIKQRSSENQKGISFKNQVKVTPLLTQVKFEKR